jgi:hypothetical protein
VSPGLDFSPQVEHGPSQEQAILRLSGIRSWYSQLHSLLQAATNKKEAFNNFIPRLILGGAGVMAENNRDDQRKILKYGHVVATCLIFPTVQTQTRVLQQLLAEGFYFPDEKIACLSPSLTTHGNRFGAYTLNLRREVPWPSYASRNLPRRPQHSR